MKSASVAACLLAGLAVAQPHGHGHHRHAKKENLEKRELFTEWTTVWETATVIIDDEATQTIQPTHTPSASPSAPPAPPSSSSAAAFVEQSEAAPSSAPPAPEPVPEPASTSTPAVIPAPEPTILAIPDTPEPEPAPVTPTTTPVVQQPPPPPPAPEPTTSYVAPPPPPPPPASTSSSSSGSGSSGESSGGADSHEGDITYYNVGLGSCGYDDTGKDESENIVAIPHAFWDKISTKTSYGINQPAHPLCDKTITIQTANGETTTATIRDRCGGCDGFAIDVTPHAFNGLFGSLEAGRSTATWWINP